MSVKIVTVENRRQLRKFLTFPFELYKGSENWVPPLMGDEYDTFNPKQNGAYEFCDACLYLAYRDDKIVGRVAAIINFKANELWKQPVVRFGWLDFIEDQEVLNALLDSVVAWGKQHGCSELKGPLGFTDMDKEGSLVEGYDRLSPFTCLYNYPYYDTLLKAYGLEKDVDWIQRVVHMDHVSPQVFKIAELVEKRYGLHMAHAKTSRELCNKYGMSIFHMYNEAFAPLFQFTPLTDRQIKKYLATYVPIMDPDFLAVCLDADDNPVGFAFGVPTLSEAVKKSNGRLFPFGFIRILRALKHNDTCEALLIGVLPEFQGKGAALLIFNYLYEHATKRGVTKVIMNPQLEENHKVQSMFDSFDPEFYMRRRSYVKKL